MCPLLCCGRGLLPFSWRLAFVGGQLGTMGFPPAACLTHSLTYPLTEFAGSGAKAHRSSGLPSSPRGLRWIFSPFPGRVSAPAAGPGAQTIAPTSPHPEAQEQEIPAGVWGLALCCLGSWSSTHLGRRFLWAVEGHLGAPAGQCEG